MALPNPLMSGFGCELGIWGEKEIWVEKEISGHPQAAWCVPSSHSSWAVVVTLPSAWSKVATKGTSTTPHPLATHPPFLMAESMSLGAVWEQSGSTGWEQSLSVHGIHAPAATPVIPAMRCSRYFLFPDCSDLPCTAPAAPSSSRLSQPSQMDLGPA